jgi:hypothetical protein
LHKRNPCLTDQFRCFICDENGAGSDMATKKRTTHRSKTGSKLYAVRNAKGQFRDIQTYKRAHSTDVKRSSKSERSK